MSTNPTLTTEGLTPSDDIDRLSPSWISRSFTRRKSVQPDSESRPTSSRTNSRPATPLPRMLLRRSSKSSTSDDCSAKSTASGTSTSLRGIVNRIRSASNAGLRPGSSAGAAQAASLCEPKDADDWCLGFQSYNQLVTTKIAPESAHTSSEFVKATKALSKNCGGGSNFIHSLPESAFDLALLWCPAGDLERRSDSSEPSWSWTAYTGPINFPFDPTTCPDLPRSTKEWFRSEISQYAIGPAESPYIVRREKRALHITYPPNLHVPRSSDPTVGSQTLRFTTQAIPASAFTAEPLSRQGTQLPISHLLASSSSSATPKHCGLIMAPHTAISAPCPKGPWEFLLLSRNLRVDPAKHTRRPASSVVHPPGTPVWDPLARAFLWDEQAVEFDTDVYDDGDWKVLNVMLVRWVEDGVAERVALGRIHEDAWVAAGPERRSVVLV